MWLPQGYHDAYVYRRRPSCYTLHAHTAHAISASVILRARPAHVSTAHQCRLVRYGSRSVSRQLGSDRGAPRVLNLLWRQCFWFFVPVWLLYSSRSLGVSSTQSRRTPKGRFRRACLGRRPGFSCECGASRANCSGMGNERAMNTRDLDLNHCCCSLSCRAPWAATMLTDSILRSPRRSNLALCHSSRHCNYNTRAHV